MPATVLLTHCLYVLVSIEDSGREYKTFRDLHAEDLEPPQFSGRPGRTIHLFLGRNSLTSVSARRNKDGSYGGTLALKSGGDVPACELDTNNLHSE